MQASTKSKSNRQLLYTPQINPRFPQSQISTSLEKKAYKGKQANNFGMKRLNKKTDINKGQEVPSINLNLQTKASQYLVQQGQAKEGGGGGQAPKTSIGSF